MSLFFSELALELDSADQELVKITLVKLSRITPPLIEDKESYYLVNRSLRDISLSTQQQFIDLAILVRDKLDGIFPLGKFSSLEKLHECLEILGSESSSTDEIYQALITLSEYSQIEDLSRYKSFLMNENPLIRCAVLEVYQYHSKLENLSDIVHMLHDSNFRVKKFATRVLNRFGQRSLINCLQKMIDSNKEEAKISAIHCMANLKTNVEIVKILEKCSLPGSDKVRSEAIRALGSHNCEETIKLLRYLQNDMSIEICELAHSALNKVEHSSISGIQIREQVSIPVQKDS
ncbi:MAG: HEAT repeat domain-containing protein [bacterium]|nr:HEAT repeat domain-containing protein [bacterium]